MERKSKPGSNRAAEGDSPTRNLRVPEFILLLVLAGGYWKDTDPRTTEEKLRQSIDQWDRFSQGQIVSWLQRMKLLPKAARHRLWIALGRKLPKGVMKYVRSWYYEMLNPDRRRAE